MDTDRLLALAGVQINEEKTEAYDAAVIAVSNYLAERMNKAKGDTGGDFGGPQRPQDVLKYILKDIERGVSVKYTQNM